MAKKKGTGGGGRKLHPEQQEIPGAEQMPKHEGIHKAALAYDKLKVARMRLNEKEKVAKKELIEVMADAGIVDYEHGGVKANIISETDVKVSSPAAAEE